MWNGLYKLASPKQFYGMTRSWTLILGLLTVACLLTGWIWGLFFAPSDYQQGDAFRLIYLHVPAALMSISLYVFMSFLSVLLLVWRIKLAGVLLPITARMGASMTFIALLTGSIWGKPMWGAWWVWDARLTSELILLLIYSVIVSVHATLTEDDQACRVAAIFTLVGFVDLPIIHYSVYWWNTLHQGATLTVFSKPHMALSMLYPLFCCLLGLACFCAWVILYQARYALLLRERRQRWVRQIVMEDKS